MKTKYSYGIACFRFPEGSSPQVLFVRKRYTYAFNNFVHGKYNPRNTSAMIGLFSGMTVEEKLDILSLNFNQIWYRVWLNAGRNSAYFASKNKYEALYIPDGGKRLRALIAKSTNKQTVWEIPKGQKDSVKEAELNCAVREFTEETKMPRATYTIFPSIKQVSNHIDDGVNYVYSYYAAIIKPTPHRHKRNVGGNHTIGVSVLHQQGEEVLEMRWTDLAEVKIISPHIYNRVKKLLRCMRKRGVV